jgi:hypothetical protein
MRQRGAMVIGVDKVGVLPPLRGAALGAEKVASWLKAEGFDVECLTDRTNPVSAAQVKTALRRFVTEPASYSMLVVYFGGHGYWINESDRWLLSGVESDPDEAVNLDGAIESARFCGIPNVVFISDACRAIPSTAQGQRIDGTDAIVPLGTARKPSKIDVFRATTDSFAAYECEIDGSPNGIMTYALMQAYLRPLPEMQLQTTVDGKRLNVVPNRKLEKFIQDTIDDELAKRSIDLLQVIEASVPSADDVYISRVFTQTEPTERSVSLSRSIPTPSAASRNPIGILTQTGGRIGQIERVMAAVSELNPAALLSGIFKSKKRDQAPSKQQATDSSQTSRASGQRSSVIRERSRLAEHFNDTLNRSLPSFASDKIAVPTEGSITHLESKCGIKVLGKRITKVSGLDTAYRWDVEAEANGDLVRVWGTESVVTLGLSFGDGSLGIIPALPGFIGFVQCSDKGIQDCHYAPLENASRERWVNYTESISRITPLCEQLAAGARLRTELIKTEAQAESLAEAMLSFVPFTPASAIYAANELARFGRVDLVESIANTFLQAHGFIFFEIALHAGFLSSQSFDQKYLSPKLPMLTRTWNMIRPRKVERYCPLSESKNVFCDSLWTTFDSDFQAEPLTLVTSGVLQ